MIERSRDTWNVTACSIWGCRAANCSECPHWPLSAAKKPVLVKPQFGRRWEEASSGLMNHFPLLVASCAYGHHLAKEAIAPDWRAGRGNVRPSAIFSWTIGSCCSCDITLTHTSSQSIVGDHFQTDIMYSWLVWRRAGLTARLFCRVAYFW